MSHLINFIKSTLISGIFVLVPLLIFLIVLEKAYSLINRLTKPALRLFPRDTLLSMPLQQLVAIILLVFLCILAGLYGKSRWGRRHSIITKIENSILNHVPGYSIIRSMGESMTGFMHQDGQRVVMARFDDSFQLGFLMDKKEGKENFSAVFIPGTPNPWSGSLYFLSNDRIQHLNISYTEAITYIKKGGLGTTTVLNQLGKFEI